MTPSLPAELIPLAKLLERDDPKVLVIVGAGVSQGATSASHASWLGLLRHGIEHLVTTDVFTKRRGDELSASLDAAFSPFNLPAALQHAELIEQNLSTPNTMAFTRWLETAFRDFKAQAGGGETLAALRDLQQAGALLLTTNYDGLLSEATKLPPVTWEEHAEFLEVINRRRSGVLHIHGHWQRPTSVVLGRSSYDRIVQDQDLQAAFKSLWLEWSWLYVGCGDGLDDPNLGRLLEWGKRWGTGALPDYFLAKADKALALASRPDKPGNLVSVGYPDYPKLPGVLNQLTPKARSWPFVPIDADFALFRNPGSSPLSVPFPSQQEYLDSQVPSLAADAEIRSRLTQHGWAFVLDVASVGKTTLALRMATAPEQRGYLTFYLDLATIDPDDVDAQSDAALRRLSRPKFLLILDNAHHQPELARRLWDQWRDHPAGSGLLLLATRTQRVVSTAPSQDLVFFEHHATNPAVELRPTPEDLGGILRHLYRRVVGPRAGTVPVPPQGILEDWHREYGSALGAFCLAVLNRLAELQHSNWGLPLEAASDWVREKWLKPLDAQNLENILCLAVFGSQELELRVQSESLPHPGKIDQLLRLGLVAKTERGQFGQYHTFSLREPGWGRLIIAAQAFSVDEETILFETAARHPTTARSLSVRLRREGSAERHTRLWNYLSVSSEKLLELLPDVPLTYTADLAQGAKDWGETQLSQRLWEALEGAPHKLVARAWEMSLQFVASFLDIAQRHQRDTEPLWKAMEGEPDKLAECAWETPLHFVASFLDTAKRHQRVVEPLWEAIEREPNKLAERAWETPLGDVASFLDTAKRHQRVVEPLWEAIEREPDKLAERAWKTPLSDVASFLDTAKRHQRDTQQLWEAIEREPDKLAERAWETPLHFVASFLDTAKRHQRDTQQLWEAIERQPDKLAERAWESPLHLVASFLDTAKRHQRDTQQLWEAIERQPDKLAERAWETPLGDVVSFLDTAERHQRDTQQLWEAIERQPDKLAARAWKASLEHVGSFLNVAKEQGRKIKTLVEALESRPEQLSAKAKNSSTGSLVGFFRHVPDTLVKLAVADFQVTHWDGIPISEPMIGATWVALSCAKADREDLKAAILTTLLRRKNPKDFPPQGMSFSNLVWLLWNAPSTANTFVPAFLDAFCTPQWLGGQYTNAALVSLATGLRMLALHQTPQISQRFLNPSLGIRAQRELSDFAQAQAEQQSHIIQFLGCAALVRGISRDHWANSIPLSEVSRLPVDVLSHHADATRVDTWQFQLWLGLRVVASMTGTPLEVPATIINQTLDLWKSNLAESSLVPESAEHRLNQNMVSWLERCSRGGQGLLLPGA